MCLVYDPVDTKEISNGHITLDWQCEFCKLGHSRSPFFFFWKYYLTKKAYLEDSYEHPNSITKGKL